LKPCLYDIPGGAFSFPAIIVLFNNGGHYVEY